jgi:GPH family glycoside/pentoside/hexuronide:cation symporter
VLRIPSFRALFIGTTLVFVAFGVGGVLGLHLGTYFWRITMTELFYWGVGAGTGTFVGMFFWARVAARIDKKPTFLLGLALFLFFAAVPILCKVVGFWPAEESALYLPFYIAAGVLYSFAIAAPTVTGTSMMADVADEDELESGRRREGVFFGASAFAAKAAVAGGQLIAGPLLDLAAILPGADPASVPVGAADTLALATGGALLLLVSAAIMAFSRYDLDRSRHAEIQRALHARATPT